MGSSSNDSLEARLAEFAAEYDAAWENLSAARLGDPVRTGFGGAVAVTRRDFGKARADLVMAGKVAPIQILATEDGRAASLSEWHQGDPTGYSVYVELWEPAGRVFHGYVDPTSRRLVQTG